MAGTEKKKKTRRTNVALQASNARAIKVLLAENVLNEHFSLVFRRYSPRRLATRRLQARYAGVPILPISIISPLSIFSFFFLFFAVAFSGRSLICRGCECAESCTIGLTVKRAALTRTPRPVTRRENPVRDARGVTLSAALRPGRDDRF